MRGSLCPCGTADRLRRGLGAVRNSPRRADARVPAQHARLSSHRAFRVVYRRGGHVVPRSRTVLQVRARYDADMGSLALCARLPVITHAQQQKHYLTRFYRAVLIHFPTSFRCLALFGPCLRAPAPRASWASAGPTGRSWTWWPSRRPPRRDPRRTPTSSVRARSTTTWLCIVCRTARVHLGSPKWRS